MYAHCQARSGGYTTVEPNICVNEKLRGVEANKCKDASGYERSTTVKGRYIYIESVERSSAPEMLPARREREQVLPEGAALSRPAPTASRRASAASNAESAGKPRNGSDSLLDEECVTF